MSKYSNNERRKIINDILSWQYELIEGDESNHDFDLIWNDLEYESENNQTLSGYFLFLRNLSDEELQSVWEENVGEWIASRLNEARYREEYDEIDEADKIIEDEFERLLSDSEETLYGYIGGRYQIPEDVRVR